MSIETDLAKASLDVTSRRDPQKLFHEMPKAELAKLSPGFNYDEFFTKVRSPQFTTINVMCRISQKHSASSWLAADERSPRLSDLALPQFERHAA